MSNWVGLVTAAAIFSLAGAVVYHAENQAGRYREALVGDITRRVILDTRAGDTFWDLDNLRAGRQLGGHWRSLPRR